MTACCVQQQQTRSLQYNMTDTILEVSNILFVFSFFLVFLLDVYIFIMGLNSERLYLQLTIFLAIKWTIQRNWQRRPLWFTVKQQQTSSLQYNMTDC
jgi:hypothetical protein